MEEKKTNEKKELSPDAQRIISKIRANADLIINRVPPKTKDKFIKLAKDEYCGDYGMLLKFLVDDLIDVDVRIVMGKVTELESRVIQLEEIIKQATIKEKEEPEKKGIKMCDGSRRGK